MCALMSCSLTIAMFDTTKKNTPQFSYPENFDFFFPKICVFNNHLGVTEMMVCPPQYLPGFFGPLQNVP